MKAYELMAELATLTSNSDVVVVPNNGNGVAMNIVGVNDRFDEESLLVLSLDGSYEDHIESEVPNE
ncbi:MAG: hypothetical protein RR619_10810 [Raoultibacter sp.]